MTFIQTLDKEIKEDKTTIDWYNPIKKLISVNGNIYDSGVFKQDCFESGWEGTVIRLNSIDQDLYMAFVKELEKESLLSRHEDKFNLDATHRMDFKSDKLDIKDHENITSRFIL